MKPVIGLLFRAIISTALIASLAALGLWLSGAARNAQGQGPVIVAFDMDPTGNGCPGGTGADCTLGPIDSCVEIADGGSFDFDVVVTNLAEGDDFAGFDYWITWTDPNLVFRITAQTHRTLGINLLEEDGAGGSFDLSQAVPDNVSPHHGIAGEIGHAAAEANPPYTQGVLGRYTAQVGPGVPTGVYDLDFSGGAVLVSSADAVSQCRLYGCTLLDGNAGYGQIAVGVPCPGAPTPTPAFRWPWADGQTWWSPRARGTPGDEWSDSAAQDNERELLSP